MRAAGASPRPRSPAPAEERVRARGRAAVLVAALLAARPAPAAEAGDDGPPLDLRLSLKATALVERQPDDPVIFPERNAAAGLWRLRLDGAARPAGWALLAAAWETRLRVDSGAGAAGEGAAAGPLPREAAGPHRVWPLDWSLAAGSGLSWRHELDRAAVELRDGPLRATLGRQAIGWGRGALFGAYDLFAPFAPLEVDREWRRGVDAARIERRLGERGAAELVVAGADRAADMAVAGRLRGAAGDADAELVAGWRAGDWLLGAGASGALRGAELHGELCAYRARDPLPAGGSLGDARLALKAVAGASYDVPLGNGLLLLAEVHHSGFGARRAADLGPLLADPAFQRRLLRGDTQIPGRWAVAVTAGYEVSPLLAASLAVLASLADGSGVAAPQLRLSLSDRLSIVVSGELPWGRAPAGAALRSEYGATPIAGFAQIAVYE